jgi:hypothetical protein
MRALNLSFHVMRQQLTHCSPSVKICNGSTPVTFSEYTAPLGCSVLLLYLKFTGFILFSNKGGITRRSSGTLVKRRAPQLHVGRLKFLALTKPAKCVTGIMYRLRMPALALVRSRLVCLKSFGFEHITVRVVVLANRCATTTAITSAV